MDWQAIWDWLYAGFSGFWDWLRDTANWLLNIIPYAGAFIFALIRWIISAAQNLVEVVHILALVVEMVMSALGIGAAWIRQVIEIFFGILATYNGATPVPIPGLPQCITNPTGSNVCAVWYIFEWTVFADGTPGAMLIPLIVLAIDLIILFYIFTSIMEIVAIFRGVTNVG